MVASHFTLKQLNLFAGAGLFLLFLLAVARASYGEPQAVQTQMPSAPAISTQAAVVQPPPPPPDPQPRPVAEVLRSGTLIVISKKSQMMFVFQNGVLWKSSPVSTGKRGHTTPSGVFAILQKRVRHRSNKYSNAPMPYMQRLTWDGIAIHAGRLPGYPASHGCIRLPLSFARSLYDQTNFTSTTVVVTNEALKSAEAARSLALSTPMPVPKLPAAIPQAPVTELAQAAPPAIASPPVPVTTAQLSVPPNGGLIQLAAADSAQQAEAEWARLIALRPELRGFEKRIEAATVNSRQVYRLRAVASDAQAACAALQKAKVACFKVN